MSILNRFSMKKTKTISETDRRLLQSGKYLFSCQTRFATIPERFIALFTVLVIGGMILSVVYISTL